MRQEVRLKVLYAGTPRILILSLILGLWPDMGFSTELRPRISPWHMALNEK